MPFYNGQPHGIHGADLRRVQRESARFAAQWPSKMARVAALVDQGRIAEARSYCQGYNGFWLGAGVREFKAKYPKQAAKLWAAPSQSEMRRFTFWIIVFLVAFVVLASQVYQP